MPTETFRAIASLKSYADMDQLLQSTGIARQSVSDVTLICGTTFNGTFYLNHGVFVRYEIDIPYGATILGVKLDYSVSGSATTDGPWLLTGGWTVRQSSNAWNDAGGVAEWVNDTDIPFGEANYSAGISKNPDNFYGGAAAFEDLSCVKGGSSLSEWSIGAGTLTGNIGNDTAGGLVSQLQSYLDDPLVDATRGVDTEEGSTYISALFQLYHSYDHSDSTVDHVDLTSCDHVNTIYHPAIEIEYIPAVTTFSLQGAAISIYSIEGTATSVLSLIGDSVSTITLEGGQMKTGQDITYVRGDDVIINVTVSLDESRTLDGSETWKWNLKRGVDSHSSLAKTSAGGTITVDGETNQPTIVIAASDFPTNTFPASVVDQLYTHELQMTKSSKVETVTRGRFTLQSDIVI